MSGRHFDWYHFRPHRYTLTLQNWNLKSPPLNYGRTVADGATLWIDRWCEVIVVTKIFSGFAKVARLKKTLPTILATFVPQFVGFSCETMGSVNSSGLRFITELGCGFSAVAGDRRETSFLFQHLSVCIKRFSVVAFRPLMLQHRLGPRIGGRNSTLEFRRQIEQHFVFKCIGKSWVGFRLVQISTLQHSPNP